MRINWEDAYSVIEPQISADGVHQWPFDPNFPIEVRFFVFGGRQNVRLNRHDYFELLYAYSGEVEYQIQDRVFELREGDLMVLNGTQYHRMDHFPRSRLKAAILYFLPELIRSHDVGGDSAEYLMPFLVQDGRFPHIIPAKTNLPAQIFDLMRRTRAELPAESNRARLSVKTYLKMVLVLLVNYFASYRGTGEVFSRKQHGLERLRPLFDYLDGHYCEAINVEKAASMTHMSKSHFMRFFQQMTGSSFIAYLNQFRVAKAQELLAHTSRSMAEISQEVGFCDQSYFGLVFRKLVRMTPREYQLQAQGGTKGRPER